jgi:hypothetical protein
MAIVAKGGGGKDFEPCPAGLFQAVCVDVVDLGVQESPFKDERTGKTKFVHKISIRWQVEVEDDEGNPVRRDDGKRFLVSQFYTLSLNEKANLRRDLESWRGKRFTEEEINEGFDVERLVGANCLLNLVHSEDGKYANVKAVLPIKAKTPKIDPEGYDRVKDREDTPAQVGGGRGEYDPSDSLPELPF